MPLPPLLPLPLLTLTIAIASLWTVTFHHTSVLLSNLDHMVNFLFEILLINLILEWWWFTIKTTSFEKSCDYDHMVHWHISLSSWEKIGVLLGSILPPHLGMIFFWFYYSFLVTLLSCHFLRLIGKMRILPSFISYFISTTSIVYMYIYTYLYVDLIIIKQNSKSN